MSGGLAVFLFCYFLNRVAISMYVVRPRNIYSYANTILCPASGWKKKLKWWLFVPPIQDHGLLLQVNNVKFLLKLMFFVCWYSTEERVDVPGPAQKWYKKFLSQFRNPWSDQFWRSVQVWVCTTSWVAQDVVFKGRSLSFISMISCTIQNSGVFDICTEIETSLNMSRDIRASLECLLLPDFSHSFFVFVPLIFKRLFSMWIFTVDYFNMFELRQLIFFFLFSKKILFFIKFISHLVHTEILKMSFSNLMMRLFFISCFSRNGAHVVRQCVDHISS